MLVDTHAHLHHEGLSDQIEAAVERAKQSGVARIINVGCDETDSQAALAVADQYENVWAAVGLHPHEAGRGMAALERLASLVPHPRIAAIGECGLDYFRNHATRADQESAFRFQIELALQYGLPMVFHVRDAFDDFFRIVDDYADIRGVVHCFTSTEDNMKKSLERGFLVALNGIMTFTKDEEQMRAAKKLPLDNMLLETDCPFLAPNPKRGSVNEPANIALIADFLAQLRGESAADIATVTTSNALKLFGIK